MAAADPQHDQRGPGAGADEHRGGWAHPVTWVAHRLELPRLELVLGELGEADQRHLHTRGQTLGRVHGAERLAQQGFEVGGAAAHVSSPEVLLGSLTISSSWRMARCRSTLVAPSVRSSARAISRLSIPSAKRMISALRRSSGSWETPSRMLLSSSRPSTRASVVWGAEIKPASSMADSGLR